MLSMPSRDTATRSRPVPSTCATSVTSGACRRSFRNSMRRSSTLLASSCGSAAKLSCRSIWRMYCSMREAAAIAFSCCRLASDAFVSW
jgi:hypothetical protein